MSYFKRLGSASNRLSILSLISIAATSGFIGCEGPAPEPAPKSKETVQANAAEESRRKLSTAISRVEPDSLATQQRRESVVNAMNTWLASSAESDVEKLKVSDANAAMLTPTALRTATAVRFTENDIVYIRDCMLLSSLTQSIWKTADAESASGTASDRQRVLELFRHLIRNVALLNADEQRIPLGLYETLLTGRGTIDDRIWAFCESLRQRQLDSVVIKAAAPGDPASTDITKAADVLVGVVVDNQLMLFDPVRGSAVPVADEKSPVSFDSAGLDAISGNDRWKSAALSAVCHPAAMSPRMLVLQERLEAANAAVLYEELVGGTSEIKPLQTRLDEVIGSVWPAGSIKLWEVPEQRIAAAALVTEEQIRAFSLLMRPFESPFERDSLNVNDLITDPNVNEADLTPEDRFQMKLTALEKLFERGDALFGKPSRRLLVARVEQLQGNFNVGMIQDYQQIRIASLQEKIELEIPVDEKRVAPVSYPLPKAILDVQRSAVGDTLYWTSMSQMSRNDMGAAVATFRNYRRQYPDEKMFFISFLNEAEALIQLGDLKSAVGVLTEANVAANPERPRVQWLLARLNAATADAPAATLPTETTPPEPASSVPAESPASAATADPTANPEASAPPAESSDAKADEPAKPNP